MKIQFHANITTGKKEEEMTWRWRGWERKLYWVAAVLPAKEWRNNQAMILFFIFFVLNSAYFCYPYFFILNRNTHKGSNAHGCVSSVKNGNKMKLSNGWCSLMNEWGPLVLNRLCTVYSRLKGKTRGCIGYYSFKLNYCVTSFDCNLHSLVNLKAHYKVFLCFICSVCRLFFLSEGIKNYK